MKYLLAALLAAAGQALGYVDLDQKMIVMKKPQISVTLSNKGERTEFIHLSLARLTNPGASHEEEKLIPVAEINAPHVYVFPLKMTLQPGQSKKVFIRRLQTVPSEETYRLIVEPQISLNEAGNEGTGIALNIVYKALLRLMPGSRQETFTVSCRKDGGEITATGTVRHEFEKVTIAGKEVEAFNVYPGTPYLFKGEPLRYDNKYYCLNNSQE
jgi:hypothetical protein